MNDNQISEYKQNDNIKVPLKYHQKKNVLRMMDMESNPYHTTPSLELGVLCDPIGSGKSLTTLSLIASKKNCNFFHICLDKSNPIGYIGVIANDIRVATLPDYQGLGVGSFMLTEVMKIYPDASAKVKVGNLASLKLFEKNNFKKIYYLLEKEWDIIHTKL